MFKRKPFFILIILVFFGQIIFAQKDKILFTVNSEKVMTSEFINVYEKNLNLIKESSQRDLENYLNLYINYKLKLQEAYQLRMDTVSSYLREYEKYENQLIQPYLKDVDLEKDLLKEAYERSKKEINVSHILIKIEKGEDTLSAFEKISAIRNRIMNGEDFNSLAKELSNDPSASKNNGNLGYFTAFQMLYPFENVAYQTKIGEISMPFKTQHGYHILKVHDIRESKGEVEVAHIMLKGDSEQNKTAIDDLWNQLQNGADFAILAKNNSQDGGTSKMGGLLPKFGTGRMIPSFENVAFTLKNEGDLSEPFKTEFGWHIIKLIKKYPIGSFEEMTSVLKPKVDQGQRAQMMGNSVINRLLKEYQIVVNEKKLALFSNPDWENDESLKKNDAIITINGIKFKTRDFYQFLLANKKGLLEQVFAKFKEEKVLEVYKSTLPEKFPELKETMKEYREGLLLFDLMQKRIWDKAEKDSLGLQNFFNTHREKYYWKERANLTIATLNSPDVEDVVNLLKQNVGNDSIWTTFKETVLLDIKSEIMETSHEQFPLELKLEKNAYKVVPFGQNFKLYFLADILPVSPQNLNEIKGKAMSDYQDQIEKDWIENLKKRYIVRLNKKTWTSLLAKYKN